jgi:hypothetical protein
VQRAVGRPAYQAFVGDDVAGLHVDDRLEQRAELAPGDDFMQMRTQHGILVLFARLEVGDRGAGGGEKCGIHGGRFAKYRFNCAILLLFYDIMMNCGNILS